jgi:hypothetical protein
MSWIDNIPGVVRWFITGIAIPLTVWFLAIRSDVSALQIKQQSTEFQIKTLQRYNQDSDKIIVNKLEEVQRSLGRLEGEIKRIK